MQITEQSGAKRQSIINLRRAVKHEGLVALISCYAGGRPSKLNGMPLNRALPMRGLA
jgi:transposase